MKWRQCSRCKEAKWSIEFYHWPDKKKRWSSWCKPCTREEHRKRYRKADNARKKYERAKAKGRRFDLDQRHRVSEYRKQKRREDPNFREAEIKQNFRSKLKRYGMTLEQYGVMSVAQDGCCAICKQPETKKRLGRICKLSVDHNHKTLAIRGLLCMRCNSGLGSFRDSIEFLVTAIGYLRREICDPTGRKLDTEFVAAREG